jgi:hypothetical protein
MTPTTARRLAGAVQPAQRPAAGALQGEDLA